MVIAKRSDWEILPAPKKGMIIAIDHYYPTEDMEIIKQGLIPEEMEDKWFIYWSDNRLFFHRSWTGFCAYVLEFEPAPDGYKTVQVLVNDNSRQHNEIDDEFDKNMVLYLIDVLMLRRQSAHPDSGISLLGLWSQIGRAAIGGHPEGEDRALAGC